MGNQYNQFMQAMMREQQPDKEKLIGIASLMRQTFDLIVHREPILTFDRQTDRFVNFSSWLTEEQFKKYTIHVPDLLFFLNKKMWIFEIDGYIHNVKDSVVRKDEERDRIYTAAKLNWRKFNEWEVLIGLHKKPNRSATVSELWPEIEKTLQQIS